MSLYLHNTLSGTREEFKPLEPMQARIYVCGPTVYDYAHLGHARCYTVYDILVRHMRSTGTYSVNYVRNITDIDDKIIKRADELGETPAELSTRFTNAFHEDMARLNMVEPDREPKVSEHLCEIIALIERLIKNGSAYVSEGDVYFDIHSFPEYGKLSHRKLSNLTAGASGRLEDSELKRKRSPEDFALWKRSNDGSASWPSPWSVGRPGWHIECSAMSMKYLGESFDLHGGGLDLVFPHHENEIAQSESATKKPFARMWVHNGFVEVDKQKMSKSLGNFFTVRDIFKRVEPEAVRYFCLTVHYRAPLCLDWNIDEQGNVTNFPQLEDAERRVEYIYRTRARVDALAVSDLPERSEMLAPSVALPPRLTAALDDDLNTPIAIAAVAEFLKAANDVMDSASKKKKRLAAATVDAIRNGFASLDKVLGLGSEANADAVLERIRQRRASKRGLTAEYVQTQIEARAQARAEQRFDDADAIRKELADRGVELMDSPSGTSWRMS